MAQSCIIGGDKDADHLRVDKGLSFMITALENKARIVRLGHGNRNKAIELALSDPLSNAAIVADLTQLYTDCSLLARVDEHLPKAIASYYKDLPFCSVGYLVDSVVDIVELTGELLQIHPELATKTIYGLYNSKTAGLISECFKDVEAMTELQMVLTNNNIIDIPIDTSQYHIERLTAADMIQISHLYSLVPAMAWTPKALTYGPCYGAFYGDTLVSIAGVHYATKWLAEIGNIVTHPKHRRLNLAYACTKAVADALRGISEKIFLCVLADNVSAIKLYLKMGFETHQELYLMRFRIR
jgi:GNAT superfamily N-acetyltransferase